MKILILCFAVALFLIACTQQQAQAPYKSGKYKLKQTYLTNSVEGTIYFYNNSQFYTTLAGVTHDYYFSQKYGRVHATCVDCSASYIFHVSEESPIKVKWTANISGSFMDWEISN